MKSPPPMILIGVELTDPKSNLPDMQIETHEVAMRPWKGVTLSTHWNLNFETYCTAIHQCQLFQIFLNTQKQRIVVTKVEHW